MYDGKVITTDTIPLNAWIGKLIKSVDIYSLQEHRAVTPPSNETNISKFLLYNIKRFPNDRLFLIEKFQCSNEIVTTGRIKNDESAPAPITDENIKKRISKFHAIQKVDHTYLFPMNMLFDFSKQITL